MAGGVALNSVANGRILREIPSLRVSSSIWHQGTPGAAGAARYVWHVLLGKPPQFVPEYAYLGQGYEEGEIRAFPEDKNIKYQFY